MEWEKRVKSQSFKYKDSFLVTYPYEEDYIYLQNSGTHSPLEKIEDRELQFPNLFVLPE